MKSKPSISDDEGVRVLRHRARRHDAGRAGRCPFCQDKEVPPKHPWENRGEAEEGAEEAENRAPTAPAQAEEPQKGQNPQSACARRIRRRSTRRLPSPTPRRSSIGRGGEQSAEGIGDAGAGTEAVSALRAAVPAEVPSRMGSPGRLSASGAVSGARGEPGRATTPHDDATANGKSELGSRHFPPREGHPDWEIIAASHTSSLTLFFSRYIRDLVKDLAYQVLFENMRLDPSSQSVEN